MIVKEVECKSLLNRSALADYCINPYVGCQHACKYCYAESYTRRFSNHREVWGEFVDVKVNASLVLAQEVGKKPKGTVYLSSLTDPYQPIEREYELTRKLLKILLRHQFPVSIQTKSALILRDVDLIKKFAEREVGFTITTLNDDFRMAFEPMSSSVEEKLHAIKELKENGVKTYVFFGPVLPLLSDVNLEGYFRRIAGVGVDYILVDKLNLRRGLWVSLERFLLKNFPDLHGQWKNILLGKSDYYEILKARINGLSRESKLECRFCF